MFKVVREGKWIRIVDPTGEGPSLFEFEEDSYFMRDGVPVKVSTLSDEEILRELVRTGRIKEIKKG